MSAASAEVKPPDRATFEKDMRDLNAEIEALQRSLERATQELQCSTPLGDLASRLQHLSCRVDDLRSQDQAASERERARKESQRLLKKVAERHHGCISEVEINARLADLERQRQQTALPIEQRMRVLTELAELSYSKPMFCNLQSRLSADAADARILEDQMQDDVEQQKPELENRSVLREQYQDIMNEGICRMEAVARLRDECQELHSRIESKIELQGRLFEDFQRQQGLYFKHLQARMHPEALLHGC